MLIEQLRNDALISQCLCNVCEENGVGINIDPTIDRNNIVIIKVDDFYHKNVHPQPKSPDCLIIQYCGDNTYSLCIAELRNIDGPDGFSIKEIEDKFITCLGDLMYERFGNYFYNADYHYSKIRLLFVTDPYGYIQNPEKRQKMRGHKLDALMSTRIPKFFGMHLYIEHEVPEKPTIRNCSYTPNKY